MKILFHQIRKDFPTYGHRLDYSSDCLFHGLRSLLGEDCVDFPRMEHMYKDNFDKVQTDKCKGFTLYNRLDRIETDPDQDFDYIICAIHHSTLNDADFIGEKFEQIEDKYNKFMCLVDGNDQPGYIAVPRRYPLFKREYRSYAQNIYPLCFSIPKENIVDEIPEKTKDFADLIPCYLNRNHPHEATYKFNEEEQYNQDYKDSYFGFTCSKGGWDCLRHYEILANGCVPFFTDLDAKPQYTMYPWPSDINKQAMNLAGVFPNYTKKSDSYRQMGTCDKILNTEGHFIDHQIFNKLEYEIMLELLLNYTRENLTTEASAKYVLNVLRKN